MCVQFTVPSREEDSPIFQAQQEVPAWLEEMAEKSLGQGFAGTGGKFGGRDTRKGKVSSLLNSLRLSDAYMHQ